jgi:hypothetical protein
VKKALFGIAKSQPQAVSIFNQFKGAGFADNDISVLFPDEAGVRHFAHEQHSKMPEGAAVGGAGGVVIGGVLGWLIGIGMLAIPWLGPLVAAGPIIAALAGAGAGAAIGFAIGSIIGMGMPEFEAVQYQGKMDDGDILISVLTADATERRRAKEIFKNAGSVTAAEAVVDHAYNRPSGAAAVGVAMTPASQQISETRFTDHAGPAA